MTSSVFWKPRLKIYSTHWWSYWHFLINNWRFFIERQWECVWMSEKVLSLFFFFCGVIRLHTYVWHVMTLIVVFSTLRLETLCTFSHEPPRLVLFCEWGLCACVIVHAKLPLLAWEKLGGKPKWLPLKFENHDVMCSTHWCQLWQGF